jgi:hypothetical protein
MSIYYYNNIILSRFFGEGPIFFLTLERYYNMKKITEEKAWTEEVENVHPTRLDHCPPALIA